MAMTPPPRYKRFSYVVDSSPTDPKKAFVAKFEGMWSRGDVDRMHKIALKHLRMYKHEAKKQDQRKKEKEDERGRKTDHDGSRGKSRSKS